MTQSINCTQNTKISHASALLRKGTRSGVSIEGPNTF